MKAVLALAAILTISVSTCSQLHAQSDAKENPHSQQIPNNDPYAHAQSVPNWARTQGAYVQPIPNWRPAPPLQTDSSTVGSLTTSNIVEDLPLTGRVPIQTPQLDAQSGARQYPHAEKLPNAVVPPSNGASVIQTVQTGFCVIVKQNAKRYDYVEGTVPGRISQPESFSDRDIRKIVQSGGAVHILGRGYSEGALRAALNACQIQVSVGK